MEKKQFSENTRIDPTYDIVTNQILVPLMKGFAAARSMASFLVLWHAQLSTFFVQELQERGDGNFGRSSAWEDNGLAMALHELLEASLTNRQISQLLSSFGSSFESDSQNEVKTQADTVASVMVQRIILSSLHRDETIKELFPTIREIQENCFGLLFSSTITDARCRAAIWNSVSVSQALRMSVLDTAILENEYSEALEKLDSSISEDIQGAFAKATVLESENGIHALNYLGSSLTSVERRNITFKPYLSQMPKVFASLSKGFSSRRKGFSELTAIAFATMLAKFPVILK